MDSPNDLIREYKNQLSKGMIQEAYKYIMKFMSDLSIYLKKRHSYYNVSALYYGYMDMTYFAFTPDDLKSKKLKIAIVYLHEKGRFEVWLSGSNRKIQAEYIDSMSGKDIGGYKLSQVMPGVDSIIEAILVEQPDFDHPEELKKQIEKKTIKFIDDITAVLKSLS